MTSTTKVTKSFTLPKLRSDGSNWILFQDSVELECASHVLKNHIDGTGTEPVNPHLSVQSQAALTAAQQTAVEEFEKKLEKWVSGELQFVKHCQRRFRRHFTLQSGRNPINNCGATS